MVRPESCHHHAIFEKVFSLNPRMTDAQDPKRMTGETVRGLGTYRSKYGEDRSFPFPVLLHHVTK